MNYILVTYDTRHFLFQMLLPAGTPEKKMLEIFAAKISRHKKHYSHADISQMQSDIMGGSVSWQEMEAGTLYRDGQKI